MLENRKYLFLPVTEISKIDFSQTIETSSEELQISPDGQRTYVQWEGADPTFIADLVDAQGPYDNIIFQSLLETSSWVYIKIPPPPKEIK